MKTNKWMTRLLSGALVALGFTACDDENNGDYPDDYPLEYGSPSVEYRVKGTVTDEAGNPIENIRVIIRNHHFILVKANVRIALINAIQCISHVFHSAKAGDANRK